MWPRQPTVARYGNRHGEYWSGACQAARWGGVEPAEFAEALAAAQCGAPWACTEIWVRYAPGVSSFLRARGSREPEDLTSEVFLTVFRRLGDFSGDEANFRSFVYTVAHRRLVDELRRRSRRPVESEWSESADPRRAASAEEGALAEAGASWAREMIGSLSPDQRDVLLLRIFGDLTVEQVAAVLGKGEGAVKALQRRGLSALKRKNPSTPYPCGTDRRWQGGHDHAPTR